jgi:hypothetical protein
VLGYRGSRVIAEYILFKGYYAYSGYHSYFIIITGYGNSLVNTVIFHEDVTPEYLN